MQHDFDPSGDDHPDHCMCPCCDLAEGRMDPEDEDLTDEQMDRIRELSPDLPDERLTQRLF